MIFHSYVKLPEGSSRFQKDQCGTAVENSIEMHPHHVHRKLFSRAYKWTKEGCLGRHTCNLASVPNNSELLYSYIHSQTVQWISCNSSTVPNLCWGKLWRSEAVIIPFSVIILCTLCCWWFDQHWSCVHIYIININYKIQVMYMIISIYIYIYRERVCVVTCIYIYVRLRSKL